MKLFVLTLLLSTQLVAQSTFQILFNKGGSEESGIVQLKTIEMDNGDFYSLGAIIKYTFDGDLDSLIPTLSHFDNKGSLINDTLYSNLNLSLYSDISYDADLDKFILVGFKLTKGVPSVRGASASIDRDFSIQNNDLAPIVLGDILSPVSSTTNISGDEKIFSFLVEGLIDTKLCLVLFGKDGKIKNSKVHEYVDNYNALIASNNGKTYLMGENTYEIDNVTLDITNPKAFENYIDNFPLFLPYKEGFVFVEDLFPNTLFILDENLNVINSKEIFLGPLGFSSLYMENMTVDKDDNILLLSDAYDIDGNDFVNILKFDKELNMVWSSSLDLNPENSYYFVNMDIAKDGGIVLSGEVESENDNLTNGIVIKLTGNGLVSSIKELDRFIDFDVYPNPSHGELSMSRIELENIRMTIIDVFGKKVYQNVLLNKEDQIDLSYLKSGNYFIEIFNNDVLVGTKKWTKL